MVSILCNERGVFCNLTPKGSIYFCLDGIFSCLHSSLSANSRKLTLYFCSALFCHASSATPLLSHLFCHTSSATPLLSCLFCHTSSVTLLLSRLFCHAFSATPLSLRSGCMLPKSYLRNNQWYQVGSVLINWLVQGHPLRCSRNCPVIFLNNSLVAKASGR